MKTNVILHDSEAAEKLIKGADFLADSVKKTLGPWGGNAISGVRGEVLITNDGKRIADLINSEDEIEQLGIRTLRGELSRANDVAGDASTTAYTFTQAIIKGAKKHMKSGKTFKGAMAPVALKEKIKAETAIVIDDLKAQAKPVETKEELIAVARVSVQDADIAETIGSTQWDLGKDGTIIPEESNDKTDSIERIVGVRFDNGFGTTLVLNDLEKQALVVKDARVILTDYVLSGPKALAPLAAVLEQLANMQVTDVVLIARAFSSEAIQICMENHKSGFRIYPINAPYTDQAQVMKDIAAVTGGSFIANEDRELDSIQLSDVGFAAKVISERFSTIITGKESEEVAQNVAKRAQELREAIEGSQSQFEKKNITARLSQLENGFALYKVGGTSLLERKYKFDKIEDCCHAVKAALQEGTVQGAGLAFKEAGKKLPEGAILKDACDSIYNQIMANAGQDMPVEDWVRDPLKILRIVAESSAAAASEFCTAVVAINVKNDKPRYVEEITQTPQESN